MKTMRQMDMEEREEILEVVGPAVRDGGGGHGVLENQVPADDPGKQLAERRVGVGVGRARDGHHGGKFRVAQGGENARDSGDDEGQHQRGAGAIVRRDARQDEDAGADDGADAEARELDGTEDAAQAIVAVKFFEEDAVRLAHEQLVWHV